MKTPPIVSPDEWEAAREQLLVKERELTRARGALAARRAAKFVAFLFTGASSLLARTETTAPASSTSAARAMLFAS